MLPAGEATGAERLKSEGERWSESVPVRRLSAGGHARRPSWTRACSARETVSEHEYQRGADARGDQHYLTHRVGVGPAAMQSGHQVGPGDAQEARAGDGEATAEGGGRRA